MSKHLTKILVIVMLLAFAGAVFAVGDVITLKSATKGDVKFSHKKHTEYVNGSCVDCHHKTPAGGTPKACTSCHDATGAQGGGLNAKAAFHKQCAGCHKKMNKGPMLAKCNECHGN